MEQGEQKAELSCIGLISETTKKTKKTCSLCSPAALGTFPLKEMGRFTRSWCVQVNVTSLSYPKGYFSSPSSALD